MDGLEDNGAAGEQEYAWLETYFVLISAADRPTLTQVEATLGETGGERWTIENLRADDDGLFESLLVRAPDDNAALEVRYESGEMVQEQALELASSLKEELTPDQLAAMAAADARLDVLHLEQVAAEGPGDGAGELGAASDDPFAAEVEASDDEWGGPDMMGEGLDPGTLLMVVEALAKLTGGLPFDPAAGEVLV
ncbi:MAG: hypothetical protein AAFV43_06200 [Planctomycetota bacterium]